MRRGDDVRTRRGARPRKQDPVEKAFLAQERWIFIGMGVMVAVAMIAFALDWVKDPLAHSILLKLMAVGGVAILVTVPLGLGATAVFWRTRANTQPARTRKPRTTILVWADLLIVSAGLGAGLLYLMVPSWRGALWILYVILSLLVVGWRLRTHKS